MENLICPECQSNNVKEWEVHGEHEGTYYPEFIDGSYVWAYIIECKDCQKETDVFISEEEERLEAEYWEEYGES
jgi:predicted nucleic-acid-binding Zn-ribbon protein